MRQVNALTNGLLFLLAMALSGCGTLQVSVQVQMGTPTPDRTELSDYVFADVIALRGYSLPDLDVLTGTEVLLRLYWTVKVKPSIDFALDLRLRDAGGMIVWGSTPVISWQPGSLITEQVLYFPPEIAPGEYTLEMWLYDPADGARASVKGPNQDGVIRLATLRLLSNGALSPQNPTSTPVPVVTAVFTMTSTVRPH